MRLALAQLRHARRWPLVLAGVLSFALVASGALGHGGRRLEFGCPPPSLAATAVSQEAVAEAAPGIVSAAALHRGASAGTGAEIVATIEVGVPGMDPSAAAAVTDDLGRRCRRVRRAWALVAFRRSGEGCCLETTFVVPAGTRWFVF